MKKLLLIPLFLFLTQMAWAQAARYDGIALGPRGKPLSGAFVAVCTQPANVGTQPCSPLATLGTSLTTTTGGTNPVVVDPLGNFHFYAAPGIYTLQLFGPSVATPFVQVDIAVGGNGGATNLGQLNGGTAPAGQTYNFGAAAAVTLPMVGNGAVKPVASDGILTVSTAGIDSITCGLSWSSTACATVQQAYTNIASSGGTIIVGCGTFTLTSTLNLNTNGKPIKLHGSGPCTIFNYTSSTGLAMLLDTGGGNPSNPSVLSDFTLSTTVVGSTATGLKVGSVNTAKYSIVRNVNITGFKELADANAFAVNWDHVHLEGCSSAVGSSALFFDTVADDNHFLNGTMAGCSKLVDGTGASTAGPQWMQGEEFFQTAPGEIEFDLASSLTVHCENCHLVAEAGTGIPDFFSLASNGALHLTNTIFEDDNISGSYSSVGQVSNGFISINEAHVNFAGATTTNLVSISGTSGAYIADVNNDGSAVTGGIVNSSFSGPLTELGTQAFNGTAVGLKSSSVKLLSSGGGSVKLQAPNTTADRAVSWPDFAGSVAIASGPFNLNDCLAVAAIDAGGFPQIGDAGPCGSGGGSPGGTNTAVQFNNSSAFGGDATNFNFNPTTHALTITGAMHTQNSSFALSQLVDGSFQGDTICADNTLTWNDCIGGVGGRTVTTTSDTLVSGDRQQQVTYNAASAVATSIGSAASLGNNYVSYLRNENAGTVTITPTTSTINGASSATLLEGYHATLTSPDNTNYFLDYSPGLLSAGTNITLTQTQFGTQISASGGSGGLSGMTAGQIPVAATASTVTSSKALAGTDSSIATTAGSLTNGALACGDSLGGVTTTGCTAGTGPNELNLTSVTGNMTATTTPTNVTGISMSVLANTTYIGQCFLQTSASAGTTQITWTGPASPTAVSFSGTLNASMGTAFGTLVNGTSSTTRQAQATVFYLENGANAGSIQLQFQNSSTGTSTMYAGSYCIIHQKGAN